MKIVVDMNVEPSWIDVLVSAGHDAVHWSQVGRGSEPDDEILRWAISSKSVVLTQDLDFGAILAATGGELPSVVLLRSRNGRPKRAASDVLWVLSRYTAELASGALVVVDPDAHRVRMLPLT
ncbi:MAG TPA: DUF5615 family PIN-like protein [Tepidiformaceae bacterium]|nr:DUF5615 family PIN-like protein [Tepidiformaceae bacterium]